MLGIWKAPVYANEALATEGQETLTARPTTVDSQEEILTIVEEVSVTSEGLVLKIQGTAPQTKLKLTVDEQNQTNQLLLTLEKTKLAFSVPINKNQPTQDISGLQIRQDSTRQVVEIRFNSLQNWQVITQQQALQLRPAALAQNPPDSVTPHSPSQPVVTPEKSPLSTEPKALAPLAQSAPEQVPTTPEESLPETENILETPIDKAPMQPVTPLNRQPIRLLHLNTANQLQQGDVAISFGETQTIQGGFGTGNQSYFAYLDWGVTDNLQLGWTYMINDDPTYNPINRVFIPQQYQATGPNLKYRFYQDEHWSLGILSSLEQFQIYSGPGLFNNYRSPTVSNTIAGTVQFPISYRFNEQFQVHITPAVNIFSNSLNGVPFYGTVFNLGLGGSWLVSQDFSLFANAVIPLTGDNAFNANRDFYKTVIWSAGGTYAFNKAIAVELHVTNSFGGTPTTGVLTLPTAANEVLIGGQFIMVPSAKEVRQIPYSEHQKKLLFDGFTLTSPYVLPTDNFGIRLAGDSKGSIGGGLYYGFLQNFQAEVLFSSISGFDTQSVLQTEAGTETQYRLGGKLMFLNQADQDPFSLAGRLTVGRDIGNEQGYMMLEFPFMYEFNSQLAALFSPKAAINGGNTPVGLGLGLNYQILPAVQLIGEVTPIVTGERTVWAAGLRFLPMDSLAIDLLGTNATSLLDLGELVAEPGTRFSASIQWHFGPSSSSRPSPAAVPSSQDNPQKSLN
ncbi:DUF5777 family beta-barrel protein [Synechocystis sp. LKSZ1]|uniref:DUF5777 family beta-barrel protein n=1 Tax=Synechocystis sp. LKSZ1 TaxID=3144951 RepID=UPI00336BCE52